MSVVIFAQTLSGQSTTLDSNINSNQVFFKHTFKKFTTGALIMLMCNCLALFYQQTTGKCRIPWSFVHLLKEKYMRITVFLWVLVFFFFPEMITLERHFKCKGLCLDCDSNKKKNSNFLHAEKQHVHQF